LTGAKPIRDEEGHPSSPFQGEAVGDTLAPVAGRLQPGLPGSGTTSTGPDEARANAASTQLQPPRAVAAGEPATADEFLDLVHKSRLVDARALAACVQQLRGASLWQKPAALAAALVQAGLVTCFQAEQLLLGKWRGFTIGTYLVLERLGCGGMGNVYLCQHPFLHRRIAIKVPFTHLTEDPSIRERFLREAQAASRLDHPNVVRVYDFQSTGNQAYMVLEYIDGSNLRDIVLRHGPLAVERVAHYASQAAGGLQHIHDAGLVHRDIKPGNLLLSRAGKVTIFDLGLIRFVREKVKALTGLQTPVGTADYIAPEQAIDSRQVEARVDIYGLGATCYFLLTGQPPFAEGGVAQKLILHQTQTPQSVRVLRPDAPAELAALIDRMLAKDPAQRPGSAAAVIHSLTPWVGTPIPPPPEAEMPRLCPALQRRPAW
jgi:eukaryotic-like serine/threonine-protein kinase